MEMNICQSCAMPLEKETLLGTNKDGSKNEEYCIYCYENGEFKQDMEMNDMADLCVKFMKEEGMEESKARDIMNSTLPTLKRWR
ncbi:zinc ribbon domain-containing protein [Clostridium manihotivorum]|uniref:Transcriptional regulator n=1 Tax=Clostridium manihotivorum TaxID=2320868 RepID=A0A410DMI7_9CLOT|nr:zinc ribbon domain-containing protein [Clostridium manihotivorum]QAA30276.1 transcriptional regulator [Clostridium manihotivorum]